MIYCFEKKYIKGEVMDNLNFMELTESDLLEIDGGKANIANAIGGTAGIVGIAWAPVAVLTLGPIAGLGIGIAGAGALINLISD